ncbi:epidermal growth factor receptor substrate 15 [Gracilaria domingensis]|nr:epidermal growth factor receptor substrate 15 [Gracilaria domingensis]
MRTPGQGPLADRPVTRGANGLYEAPEPEGPEQHPANQHMALNPGEVSKYMEYWGQACDGAYTISGSDAVPFLSRAAKVSKGQLRKVWDIADHRKEGKLDQNQFFIALRLIALAQRGAALFEAGLRNFRGIQLIPSIAPPPVKEQPVAQHPMSPTTQQKRNPTFSWTAPKQIVHRYDSFFHQLDDRKLGMIDGKQGVTFFGKSCLPRSTLKLIWQLADVTKDGKLSLDEFRAAMHMVTNIRNKRLSVETLPTVLDPSGPNWFRVEGEQQLSMLMAPNAQHASPLAPNPVHSHPSPSTQIPAIPQLSPTAHTVQRPGHRRQPSSSGSRTPGRVAPPAAAISLQPHLASNLPSQHAILPPPPQQAIISSPPPPPAVQQNDVQEQIREAL